MALQLLAVVVVCVLVLLSNVKLLMIGARSLSPEFLGSVLFTGAQLVFSVVTAIAFVRRKRSAVLLMLLFYVFAIVAAVVGEGTAWLLPSVTLPGGVIDAAIVQTLAFTGPWMSYLVATKRVKQTFVVP